MSATQNYIGDSYTAPSYATGDEDLCIGDVLEVQDNAYKPGGGSWLTSSDSRLKRDIHKYQDGLEQILNLEPVWYKYNSLTGYDTTQTYVGLIAQDLKKVAPYMVNLDKWGLQEIEGENGEVIDTVWDGSEYYSIDPSALDYMQINAIQQQQEIIEAQQKQIDTQSEQIEELMNRVEALESRMGD